MALPPPPTFANPIDQTTKSFDPVWLQWFLDYAALSNAGSAQTSTIVQEINTLNTEVSTLNSEMTAVQNFTQGGLAAVSSVTLASGATWTNSNAYNVQVLLDNSSTNTVANVALRRAGALYRTVVDVPAGTSAWILAPNDAIVPTLTTTTNSTTITVVPI